MVTRPWVLPELDPHAARELAQTLSAPTLVAEWLLAHKLDDPNAAKQFLEARKQPLSDPMELTGMDAAVQRLKQALESDEKVHVFGDYDVDGMSAMAILAEAFTEFGLGFSLGMPERLEEGYGLKPTHVRAAHEAGASILITVDNGVAAFEAAEEAQRLGMDLIVTDHHEIGENLPPMLAMINPKQDPADAPFADLCGAGLAFKLASALLGKSTGLGLAAVATIADSVPLRDENRTLVMLGLDELAKKPPEGLRALAKQANTNLKTLRAEEVAFQLAPRINAASRLGNARASLNLLQSHSAEEAEELSHVLDLANTERRQIEKELFESLIEKFDANDNGTALVAADHGWHAGVIGIVASRLATRYQCPAVLISLDDDGVGRASARCPRGYHLAKAFAACAEHLVQHGGHALAAGLTIKEKSIPAFREAFSAHIAANLPDEDVEPLEVDAVLDFGEINGKLMGILDSLEPHGHGNPAPLFATMGVEAEKDSVRWLNGGHLRCRLVHNGYIFPAIGFNMVDAIEPAWLEKRFDVAYRPGLNTWRGETRLQLAIKAIRKKS